MTNPNNWENNRVSDVSGWKYNYRDISFNKGNIDCTTCANTDEIFIIWTDISDNCIRGAYTPRGWDDPSGDDWTHRLLTEPQNYQGGTEPPDHNDPWLIGDNVCCCNQTDSSSVHIAYTQTSSTLDINSAQLHYYLIRTDVSGWSHSTPSYDLSGTYYIKISVINELLTNIKSLAINVSDKGVHFVYFTPYDREFMHIYAKHSDLNDAVGTGGTVNPISLHKSSIITSEIYESLYIGYNSNIQVDGSNAYISFYGISGEDNSLAAIQENNIKPNTTLFLLIHQIAIQLVKPKHHGTILQ